MKTAIKKLMVVISTVLLLTFVVAIPTQQAYADAKTAVCSGVGQTTGQISPGQTGCETPNGSPSIDSIVVTFINILSLVVGVISVIMIIFGGFRYVLSGGDSNNTNAARNTILYAIVGLVIAAVAQIIVHFVLFKFAST